jgi:hypothetical protein
MKSMGIASKGAVGRVIPIEHGAIPQYFHASAARHLQKGRRPQRRRLFGEGLALDRPKLVLDRPKLVLDRPKLALDRPKLSMSPLWI